MALFPELGLLKVGKATPWTVRSRVKDAADKLRIRQADSGAGRPITYEAIAWAIPLFGDENVLWAVSERVEHAAAGRLAYNVGATSVDHTEGKESGCATIPSRASTGRPNFTARYARRSHSSATTKPRPASRGPWSSADDAMQRPVGHSRPRRRS